MEMIRDTIEKLAREAAEESVQRIAGKFGVKYYGAIFKELVDEQTGCITDALIAVLTEVGFKEALELAHRNRFLCQNCRRSIWDRKCDDHCTCPCHTASAKLAELQELEKGI